SMYSGSCAAPFEMACNDDDSAAVVCGGTNSAFQVTLAASTQYWVRVASKGVTGAGAFTLHVQTLAPTAPTCSPSASPSSVFNDGASPTTFTVVVTPGAHPASTAHTVTADLSAAGGGAAVLMTEGPANTFTLSYTVP